MSIKCRYVSARAIGLLGQIAEIMAMRTGIVAAKVTRRLTSFRIDKEKGFSRRIRLGSYYEGLRFGISSLPVCSLQLIVNTAFIEMGLLRFLPSAKNLIDGEQIQPGELGFIFLRHRFQTRAVIMFRRDLLPLGRIKIFEILLRDRRCASPIYHFIDPG